MKYKVIAGLLYLLSLLPLKVLYVLSDVLSFFLYTILQYRRSVVFENLSIAFPEKTLHEKKIIAKKFYRNLADSLMETFKLLSASEQLIDEMFVFDDELEKYFSQTNKKIQLHAMHSFNWEVLNLGFSKRNYMPLLGVYQPLKNNTFERIFRKIRTRYGTILIPANDFKRNFFPHQFQQYIIALVADQNPGDPAKAWWADFFGRPTPFVTGPEKAAIKHDHQVVFMNFIKVKRGVYTCTVFPITDDPATMKPGELTLRYIQFMEKCIRKRPDNYLWSHRRWKHAYKPEYEKLRITSVDL